ncbi:zinc metalloproteinase-disintegrin-like crotastatin [Convolutriloba macropyga]|uniref:zinc metalloproteinase-disintegrin-like crotastatin n=1 Tax=Convolutriloba macropyga TaxID=536237 RepID=UPI003F528107
MIDRAIETVHLADIYYATIPNLNLHLSLVEVYTYDTPQSDPTNGMTGANQVLDTFLVDHSGSLDYLPNHDNAILILSRSFSGGDSEVVGLAYQDTLCDVIGSGSWIKDDTDSIEQLAGVLAHELGHNFGLGHNPTNPRHRCYCGREACVMDAVVSSSAPDAFTSCQMEKIKDYIEEGSAMCLHNEPSIQVDAPYCGDYLVNQASEQCDCGSVHTCEDPCCNPRDCTLREGATCSSMDLCCDNVTCAIKSKGELCRPPCNECDEAEKCDGISAECPSDEYIQSGTECVTSEHHGSSPGHCYKGDCRSAYAQCLRLFEPDGLHKKIHDDCWSLNRDGDEWGNCGSNVNQNFTPCSKSNQRCGKLQCAVDAGFEPTVAGSFENVYHSTFEYDNLACYTTDHFIPSIDSPDDFAYVRDGTWCGQNSFCYDRRCVHISEIPGMTNCPKNCFGNGFCNSSNQCECRDNFGPPLCEPPPDATEALLLPLLMGLVVAVVVGNLAICIGVLLVKFGCHSRPNIRPPPVNGPPI